MMRLISTNLVVNLRTSTNIQIAAKMSTNKKITHCIFDMDGLLLGKHLDLNFVKIAATV